MACSDDIPVCLEVMPVLEPTLLPSIVLHHLFHQLALDIAIGDGRVREEEGVENVPGGPQRRGRDQVEPSGVDEDAGGAEGLGEDVGEDVQQYIVGLIVKH